MRRRIVKHLLVFYATVIALMFVAQIFHLSNYLMEEKENGTREGHITIGTNCTLLWLTWEIIYVLLLMNLLLVRICPPRHYVWDIIKVTLQNSQSATIMITHSMEVIELYCNSISIIVNEKLQVSVH
ncbi:hypothetical protein LY90DRAFT_519106 [Neocallimastix californiae]|uniref:Uncharacterized protein n=1 Tax=Neocallimastix californiae TaxID=1754190 RepID=A0A1Y1ZBE1_9FUNG|nr:hypothetical protein LY90DRAFT_519106 [Neocallimastix californiae]|eukprot:ORY07569.1 hypothetical protein LY90DRAFT_519106 [Neocallimastix californiae]